MKRRQFLKGSAILGMSIVNGKLVANSGMEQNKSARKVYRVLRSDRINVGTLPVMRAFAGDQNDYVSPFVLFDEFGPVEVAAGSDPLRVDAHPHAGVTPTTYFLEGTGHHKDSLDYDFQIGKGDFMLFSSGKGAIHLEESGQQLYDDGGMYHGFQIWLNTPAKHKFDAPTTTVFREEHMDTIVTDKYSVKVVLGELFNAKSAIKLQSPAFYYHIKMKEDTRLDIPTNPEHNAFAYIVKGEIEVEGNKLVKDKQVVLYQRGDSVINLYASCDSEILLLGGEPLQERVFSYGPFVMNNQEQINLCIKNYNLGLMGNPDVLNQ